MYFSSEVCPVGVQSDKGVFSHVTLVRVQGSGARVVECLEGNDRLFGSSLPSHTISFSDISATEAPTCCGVGSNSLGIAAYSLG